MEMTFTLHYVSLNNDKPFMLTHDKGPERYFFTRDELVQLRPALDVVCKVTMEPVKFIMKMEIQ